MSWNPLHRLFGKNRAIADDPRSEIRWIDAADTPWGVRVLDLRPVTLGMLAMSADPQCAANALSFGQDDGTGFIGKDPAVTRSIDASLRFAIAGVLADGVLFVPSQMEHKWAIFHHRRELIFVRSWQRTVQVVAHVEPRGQALDVIRVRGTFASNGEDPEFTVRVLDFLLRSHALGAVYPAPLPLGMEADPQAAATWCMSMFGKCALFATPEQFGRQEPDRPLRTHSLLHLAVARGDVAAIEYHLACGVPIDLLAGDGLAPLHWALPRGDQMVIALLLDRGASVEVRSIEGATPLMSAAQDATLDSVRFLLARGADVNARDHRGFTALHRAAELGRLDVVRLLLDREAAPDPQVDGHTPRSLAEAGGHVEIVRALDLISGQR